MKYDVIDGCPVPAKLSAEILELKRRTGQSLASCYRGADAEDLLAANGKMSQKQLYDGYVQGRPGFNPANPPGRSTHELRNDGVAYPGPVGMRLRYWMVGMDWTGSGAVVAAARELGFLATVTYPGNPREGHHLNFRKKPRLKVFMPLERGSKGRRVRHLTWALSTIESPHTGKHYLDGKRNVFDAACHRALTRWQADHHLEPDGVYGQHSARQMAVNVRQAKRRAKRRKEKARD